MNVTLKLLMVSQFEKSISIPTNESKAKLFRFFKSHDSDKNDETRKCLALER